ncbi:MAG: amino acid ABC transporter permease [Bifidobacteriaceae bacterium]|jgi:polar amino acid transport system permease protein|nr:amino acid ABC transporter permease [Bifidobacteriaceae bacterium]
MNPKKTGKKLTLKTVAIYFGYGLAILIIANIIESLFTNKKFRFDIAREYLFDPAVMTGVLWTLILTVVAMIIGVFLALLLSVSTFSDNSFLRNFAKFYIFFFRGTPIYTQLVFWGLFPVLYPRLTLGIPLTSVEFFSISTADILTVVASAIIGLGLNEAAYLSEIFRAGLESVDRGQKEAGLGVGLSNMQVMWGIVLPQAMRVIIPPTGNETISMLKTTSLVMAVPFTADLTYTTNSIANSLFLPIPLLIVACFWYLLITSILMVLQWRLEKHFGRGIVSVMT